MIKILIQKNAIMSFCGILTIFTRKDDFMRKRIYGIAVALAIAMGCSLFIAPTQVKAVETQIFQQDKDGNYILPNGDTFQSEKKLKNGKILKYYDVGLYGYDDEILKGKMLYDGEEFQFEQYYIKTGYCDIENPGYNVLDKSTQIFCTREKPETYFPALTATKKVNDLINKYKDPSQHLLPEKVDKTSTVYKEMQAAAEEATKDCKTDYEKIVAVCDYVGDTIEYDISKSNVSWNMEKAWINKCGVCSQFADIMERMMNILGIPSCYVEGKNHACVISYDKDSKRWVYSDPTNGILDWDPYTRAGQADMVISNVNNLKLHNAYYCMEFNRENPEASFDYDNWDFPEKWGLILQDCDYTNGTDITITDDGIEGIPFVFVGERAFRNDTQLTSLSLPSSVERVKADAFWGASNLKSITFANSGEGLKRIDSWAFKDCSSLESIDLSNATLTEIPSKAFENCTSLKSVKLPSMVTKIADDAFAGCRNLEEITGLSDCNISEIGTDAFYGCSKLKSLDFSKSTFTALPDKAFQGLRNLTSITVPKTLTTIGAEVFGSCGKIEEITGLSDCNITSIGESAFASCESLKEADLSKSSFTILPASAFHKDAALTSVKMPSSLKEMGEYALYGCESIDKIDFTDTALTTIGEYGFGGMSSLMYINLPDTVNSVGANAFDLTWRLDSSDTALLPTLVSENVDPSSVGFTENNVSPWRRRYVVFRNNAYAVYFDGNGADGTTVNDPIFGNAGTRISIPSCKYTKKGYLFKEWNTKKDGSGTSYKAGTRTTDSISILYAQWQKATAKVTLNFEGGKYTNASGSSWNDSYTFTASFSSTSSVTYLPFASNMTKEGYTFAGWYTEPEYKKRVTSLTINTATDGMTLYAKWNDNHEHVWDEGTVTTEPTCTTAGTKTYVCSICGKTKTEEIAATGHQHTEIRNAKEATCKDAGYTGDLYCKDCDTKLSSGEKLEKKEHEWDKGKVTTEATCKAAGVKTYTCRNCEETKTEEIPMTDHTWDTGKVTTAPTCTDKGVRTYTCTFCGATKTEEIEAIGHQHTEIRNEKAPTCTEAGYTGDTYCKDCDTKLSEGKEIPATGHQNKEVRNKKDATCTKAGYTGDTYCKDCGTKLSDGEDINALGHTWESKVTKKATYTAAGQIIYTCSRCGEEKIEALEKLAYPKAGTKYTVAGCQYKVTKAGAEVSLIKTNKTAKSVTIPATIRVSGVTYKVTSIGVKAFNGNKKLTKVTIGANVKAISNNAFYKCPMLKTVTIKSVLLTKKTANKKAFKGTNKKMMIKVPKKVKKTYVKIFKGLKIK